jgi:hypothetical protein
MSFNPSLLEQVDEDGTTLLTIDALCPGCNSKQKSLIIMYRKDLFTRSGVCFASMKIECFKCKWKVAGEYKWVTDTSHNI